MLLAQTPSRPLPLTSPCIPLTRLLLPVSSMKHAPQSQQRRPLRPSCSSLEPSGTSGTTSLRTVERPAPPPTIPAVQVVIQPRKPPSIPRPVPVVHSSAYLQLEQREDPFTNSDSEDAPTMSRQHLSPPSSSKDTAAPAADAAAAPAADAAPFQGSVLQWTLRKVDESLAQVEAHPHPVQQRLYDISRGPLGQAAASGVSAAAGLTVKAGLEAAKAMAPVGGWALKTGAKAALGLVQLALVESSKHKERQKEKEKQQRGKDK